MKMVLLNKYSIGLALFGAIAIGSLSACTSTPPSDTPESTSEAAAASGPTDPEIAHIVVTANTVDVQAGELAKKKSNNKQVKEFANRMITDHTAVNKQAVELATRLGVIPQDNSVSQSLKDGASENVSNLKDLSGKDFDKAYIDHEVAYHQTVLDALDNTLIPNADNEELKALMVKVRPAFVAHLEHAKHMQSTLSE